MLKIEEVTISGPDASVVLKNDRDAIIVENVHRAIIQIFPKNPMKDPNKATDEVVTLVRERCYNNKIIDTTEYQQLFSLVKNFLL